MSVRLVEQGLTLNIDQLIKARFLIPGSRTSGRIDWTFGRTGQSAAAVGYESQLALPNAYLRLYFTVSDPIRGESHSIEQEIRLTTTRPRFGGVRWWFICPHSGGRVGRFRRYHQRRTRARAWADFTCRPARACSRDGRRMLSGMLAKPKTGINVLRAARGS